MKFTGERFLPSEQGKIRLEHMHRYSVVAEILENKVVLDLACGEGYGSAMIADRATSVTGVDISDEAIQHARKEYNKPNLTFIEASASKLPLLDFSFDAVISFETLEHLSEQAQMVAEIRRVLKPEGFLIISSPNRPVYSEENTHNEFHVKELDLAELDEVLTSSFRQVKYYGQRMLMGSVIQELNNPTAELKTWTDDGDKLISELHPLVDPVYFIAVCGDKEIELPRLSASLLLPNQLDLIKHYVGFARWAQNLAEIVSEREEQIRKLEPVLQNQICEIENLAQLVQKQDAEITRLTDKVVRRSEWALQQYSELQEVRKSAQRVIEDKDAALLQAEKNIARIQGSYSWRITNPLRILRRWMILLAAEAKILVKFSLRSAKKIYQLTPLSARIKGAHRNFICKNFPRLLLASGTPPLTIPGVGRDSAITGDGITIPIIYNKREFLHITIPGSQRPLLSIIIPIYGNLNYTLRCLASISKYPPSDPFEVVVVDDQSQDDSFAALTMISGIRVIRNRENLGFIRSCNNGAANAQGKYLLFLNNDTEVLPGWADELVHTFEVFPGTGLAGSKLLYPDGRLQEAGGIIWRDGSAWNFGRYQDPKLPTFNYAREVDYCSGASILVPKLIFDELGGFDEHYLPAYCEDSDLALKIREKGCRVIYQPLSAIIHNEGVTSGTDINLGVKAYQVENMKKCLYDGQID